MKISTASRPGPSLLKRYAFEKAVHTLPPKPSGSQARAASPLPLIRNANTQFIHAPLGSVHRDLDQPRKTFPADELQELADSIASKGVIEPLIVRLDGMTNNPQWIIIAGERRYQAAKLAKLETVPCLVRHNLTPQDVLEIQIIENLHRSDIKPLEEAAAYSVLLEKYQLKTDGIAKKIGKSVRYVQGRLQLLTMPAEVTAALQAGQIHADTALQLDAMPDDSRGPVLQQIIAKRAIAERYDTPVPVRAARQVIEEHKLATPQRATMPTVEEMNRVLSETGDLRNSGNKLPHSKAQAPAPNAGKVDDKAVEWLTHCPAHDVNFTSWLDDANLATVAMALYKLPKNASKTVRARLEAAHRRLSRDLKLAQAGFVEVIKPQAPASPPSPAKPSGAQVKFSNGWQPATFGAVARALQDGRPIKLPKDANAIRLIYERENIILENDLDGLRGAGVPIRLEFGKCPTRGNRVAQRKAFQPV